MDSTTAPPPTVAPSTEDLRTVKAFRDELGVMAWHGNATGSWWAYVQTLRPARLLEAEQPKALATSIRRLYGWER